MKKIIVSVTILLILVLFATTVYATKEQTSNTLKTENPKTTSELIQKKEEVQKGIDKYVEKYGSESYGTVAYFLKMIRIYSIPFCFIGIAIGGIYQYALGTRRLDMKQKGFALILSFVTILVICQVLPLIFVVVVKGWRG